MNGPIPVGLEVSKDILLVASEAVFSKIPSFPSTRSGHKRLVGFLRQPVRPGFASLPAPLGVRFP